MSEKSNSDQNKKSGSPSKSNPLADALERLERSVAQREGSRMTSLVKPIKEGANESNGELSKTPSTAEEIIKEPSNSINREEINSNKTGYSAKLSLFIFSSFIVTALFIALGVVFWPYAKKLLNSELTAIHEAAISDKEPLNEGILNKLGDVNLRLDVLSKNLDQISSLSNSSAAEDAWSGADSKKSSLLPADQKKDEDGSQEEKHPVAELVNQCMCGRKVC